MSSSHYLGPRGPSDRLQDGLTEVSGTSSPPTVPYPTQDLDSFAASGVSSFTYPASTDPTLLTPVSNAGSPPLHQRTATKTAREYHSQTAVSGAQGPTPPNTSGMYYNNYELSSSQSPSPITVHPQVAEAGSFSMHQFVTTNSPPSAHHPSPREDMPPQPIDPYLPYVVSQPEDPDMQHGIYPGQSYQGVPADGTFNPRSQPPPSESITGAPLPHRMPHTASLGLAHTHPPQYRPNVQDLRNPTILPGHTSFHPHQSPIPTTRRNTSQRKKPTQPRKSSRASHRPTLSPRSGGTPNNMAMDGTVVKKEFITLADGCSSDDRHLFELRLKYDHLKGKGMWEKIGEDYDKKGVTGKGREALQMRVHRMVAKHGVWPEAEERRLEAAFEWCEENYAKLVLQRLKETGGCECWEWKKEHVESKLVKRGLMEPTLDEKTNYRKRTKHSRRRAHAPPHFQQAMPGPMGDWHSGLALQPSFHRSIAQPYDMLNDNGHVQAHGPVLTSEQDEELYDQLFNSKSQFKPDPDGSMSPEAMDLAYGNASGHSGSNDNKNSNSIEPP